MSQDATLPLEYNTNPAAGGAIPTTIVIEGEMLRRLALTALTARVSIETIIGRAITNQALIEEQTAYGRVFQVKDGQRVAPVNFA